MSECKCSMAISVLGDGCRYCQPQDQIDRLADALVEETAKADHAEELAKLLAQYRDAFDRYINADGSNIDVINALKHKIHLDNLTAEALTNYREATK